MSLTRKHFIDIAKILVTARRLEKNINCNEVVKAGFAIIENNLVNFCHNNATTTKGVKNFNETRFYKYVENSLKEKKVEINPFSIVTHINGKKLNK